MIRSKHILALLVSLVALVAFAPAASAANRADGLRWSSVEPNPMCSRCASLPTGIRHGSLEVDRRHARSLPSKRRAGAAKPNPRATVIGLHGTRIKF